MDEKIKIPTELGLEDKRTTYDNLYYIAHDIARDFTEKSTDISVYTEKYYDNYIYVYNHLRSKLKRSSPIRPST